MLMRSLTPGILGMRDEQKKKNRAKLFRESLWRLFQARAGRGRGLARLG